MITLKNISKTILEKTLFRDLSLTIYHGDRIGIVGQNGSGKSTLLRVLGGQEDPDSGSVQCVQEQIILAPQSLEEKDSLTVGEYLDVSENMHVWRYLSELGIAELPLETKISTLSGGQKTKVLLTKVFATPSTMLLLDEPTNHLDQETRSWLQKNIVDYPGAVVMVSHDRSFLNAVATKILEIDSVNTRAALYEGNYDAYKTAKAAWFATEAEKHRLQERKRKQMVEWMVLKRQEASVHPDPAKGRQLRQMEKRLEREVLAQRVERPKHDRTLSKKRFTGEVHEGKLMLRLKEIGWSYGENAVFRHVNLEIRGNEHVRLSGPNGAGKSTLLQIIVGQLTTHEGTREIGENVRVGYFSQQLESLDERKAVIETFVSETHVSETRARTVLGAFLFSEQSVYQKISSLSYGERVRLQLALLLQKEHELLVLDEPTNHLDIPSREVVEDALANYQGAILVVSHDEYFLKKIGIDTVVRLANVNP